MTTVRLRNINPLGQVDLPLINRQGDEHLGEEGIGNLEPGEVFEVDKELAGRAPSGTPGEDGYDLGEGLLAQIGNFELVAAPKKKAPPSKPAETATAVSDTVKGDAR
jgi:hypothetical protein